MFASDAAIVIVEAVSSTPETASAADMVGATFFSPPPKAKAATPPATAIPPTTGSIKEPPELTPSGAAAAPAGYLPWFDVPGRQTADVTVAFGHWSTLGWLDRPDVLALDTGCVWGGCLSAVRLGPRRGRELIQVKCEAAQTPGVRGD